RHSANVQNWSTGIKVAAILGMSILLLGSGSGLVGVRAATFAAPVEVSLVSGIGVAMIGVLWAYEGWANVAASAGETLEPQRSFPRGIVIGTAALIAIYLLANVAYVAALGPAAAARTDRVAAEAVRAALGPGAGRLIAAAVLVSMFSAANGLTLTNSRVYYAMASDSVFFHKLAEVHPRFGTPAFSVLVSSAWAIVLAATGSFEQLFTYVIFAAWVFYLLAGASVFVLRRPRPRRRGELGAPHRAIRAAGRPDHGASCGGRRHLSPRRGEPAGPVAGACRHPQRHGRRGVGHLLRVPDRRRVHGRGPHRGAAECGGVAGAASEAPRRARHSRHLPRVCAGRRARQHEGGDHRPGAGDVAPGATAGVRSR